VRGKAKEERPPGESEPSESEALPPPEGLAPDDPASSAPAAEAEEGRPDVAVEETLKEAAADSDAAGEDVADEGATGEDTAGVGAGVEAAGEEAAGEEAAGEDVAAEAVGETLAGGDVGEDAGEPEKEVVEEDAGDETQEIPRGEDEAREASRADRLESELRGLRHEVARLRSSLEEQQSARARMEEEIEALADHDPLTGLASARRFGDRLAVAIIHAQRYEQKLAVIQLDIDHFGAINERLGRSAGDDALKSVALALESTLRQGDTIARFGDDAFTILLTGLKRDEDMTVIAEKLRLALRSPFSIGGHDLHLTASLGVALFPEDGPGVDTLLQSANVALERAKKRGGDSWDVHSPRSRALAARRQAKDGALRRALAQGQLDLRWQPVVECETGAIVGVEALLRWQHEGRDAAQFIFPSDFGGLAVPLGHWTLRAACRQGRAWHDAGFSGLVVSVNVSERQLLHPALLKLVRGVLDESGLAPSCLEVELSESEIMRNPDRSLEHLTQLRDLGLRVALDGFGTGESRLGHLYRLPIDTLKIADSVVAEATTSRDHEAVITAAVALAHSRSLRVVAEGVATEAQRVLLVRRQCDRMQGDLIGPPASAPETEGLLLRQRKATPDLTARPPDGVRRLL
jgi:diguanylate cyclase (GGDEF)-like protein